MAKPIDPQILRNAREASHRLLGMANYCTIFSNNTGASIFGALGRNVEALCNAIEPEDEAADKPGEKSS